MAAHSPEWGMPDVDWQPTSSFNVPIAPPLDDPLVGPLVQLPCVNVQWVPIILGCLAQLTNPGVWLDSLTDDQRSLVLNRVDSLRSAMAGTVSTPCCDVQIRLTGDCKLQFSVNGGTSWSDVTDWATNICGCVTGCIVAPVPPNPGPSPIEQHACNIAGFLAEKVIQVSIQAMESYLGTSNEEARYAITLLGALAIPFPITFAVGNAAYQVYQDVVAQLSSQVSFVASDAVFRGLVACAIYNGIKGVGYVDASNFAAVQANIMGISYTYPWAVDAAWHEWGNLGLTNWQAAQSIAAIGVEDCTECGTFCHFWDFTAAEGIWQINPTYGDGSYVSGLGFQGQHGFEPNCLTVKAVLPMPVEIGKVDLFIEIPNDCNGCERNVYWRLSGSNVATVTYQCLHTTGYTWITADPGSAVLVDEVWVNCCSCEVGGTDPTVLKYAQLHGNGPDPFGPPNCVH